MRRFFIVAICLSVCFTLSQGADIAGTYSSNTTLADGDTWTDGDVTINTGILVNIPTGAIVTFDSTGGSSGRNLSGAGTLQIDAGGRLLLDTQSGNDNIMVNGGGKVINEGVLQIDCGADLRLSSTGSSFTNNGLIHKTQGTDGASNDVSYIFPNTTTVGGAFVNNGDIQIDLGHLNISGTQTEAGAATSSGGNFTVASGATLSFSGGWSLLRGVSSMTGSGQVSLTNENPASSTGGIFVAASSLTILDVTGDGLLWTSGILDGNGNTLRNDGILKLRGSTATVQGTGSVENGSDGEFLLESGTLTLTDANFTNHGSMTLKTATAVTTVTLAGTGTLINAATGVFTLDTGTLIANTAIQNDGQIILSSSGVITLSGTGILTNTATGLLSLSTGTLSLSDSQIINDGTAEFIDNANITLTGNGRFTNNGTFNHVFTGSGDNLILSSSVTFENYGTYDFQAGGDIQIVGTASFENHGLLKKTSSTGDASFVFGLAGFVAASGSEIQATLGVLRLASGGTSVADATWTANGGTLDIAGTWSGVIKGSSTSSMRITASGNGSVASDLTIGTGGLTFDISDNGIVWSQQSIFTQGNPLTNSGIFNVTAGGTKTLADGGEFVNDSTGTLNHSDGKITLADESILRNQGTLNFLTGTGLSSFDGVGSVINDSTGTMEWSGSALGIAATVLFRNDGQFNITGTGSRVLQDGGQLLNSSTGTITWGSATTLSIAVDTQLRNEGTFNIEGTGTRSLSGEGEWLNATTGVVNWNSSTTLSIAADIQLRNEGTFNIEGTGTLSLSGSAEWLNASTGVVNWNNVATWSIGTGLSVVNDGTVNLNGNGNRTLSGAGTFINNGTFNHQPSTTSDNLTATTSGGQFINNGDFIFANIGDFEMRDGYTFTNSATGLVQKQATDSSADQAQFFSFDSDVGAGTFDNQGTVEVLGGNFRITGAASGTFDDITLVQNDGAGTLTGGTWIANATQTGLATIDLDAFGNNSGIITIGTDATVELIQTGASLFQLSSLTTVDGALYLEKLSFTPSSALQINATGTLGGDGTVGRAITVAGTVITGGTRGTDIGTLTINSTASFLTDALLQVQIQGSAAFIDLGLDQAARNIAILALGDLDPTTSQYDSLEVTGALTFTSGTRVQVIDTGVSYQSGMIFDLIDFSGLGIAGVSEGDETSILELPDISSMGLAWDTSLFLSHGIIYVVPEPSRMIFLLLGFGLLLTRRRRI